MNYHMLWFLTLISFYKILLKTTLLPTIFIYTVDKNEGYAFVFVINQRNVQ